MTNLCTHLFYPTSALGIPRDWTFHRTSWENPELMSHCPFVPGQGPQEKKSWDVPEQITFTKETKKTGKGRSKTRKGRSKTGKGNFKTGNHTLVLFSNKRKIKKKVLHWWYRIFFDTYPPHITPYCQFDPPSPPLNWRRRLWMAPKWKVRKWRLHKWGTTVLFNLIEGKNIARYSL